MNSGLTSRTILALAIDPTSPETVCVAGDGLGLFRTTDGGTSWRRLNLGVNKMPGMDRVLSPRWFNAIAIDPSVQGTVYAASNDNFFGHFVTGVFKTTDGRDTWTPFMAGQAARQIDALAIDPTNTRSLYAGTFNIGIFKTTDGAASLSEINSGLTKVVWYPSFDSIAIAPSNAAIVYAGRPSGGLYKSTDGGMKWTVVGLNVLVFGVSINPSNPNIVYVAEGIGGIEKTTDGGKSWAVVNSGIAKEQVQVLAIDPSDPAILYAGTKENRIFKSTNGGARWVAIPKLPSR
jgi:photosystem II stability/assembly factor-like uncharacterized protein